MGYLCQLNSTRLRASLLFIGLLFFNACDQESPNLLVRGPGGLQQSIINGEQCLPNEHESAVELVVDAEIDFGILGSYRLSSYFCGGTLIAPDVVLTAAHCLDVSSLTYGIGKIKSLAYYATWDQDLSYLDNSIGVTIPKDAVQATSWKVEEEYDGNKQAGPGPANSHDIGLLFLQKPLQLKPAIVITSEESSQIVKGASVSIAGWGQRTADSINIADPKHASLVGQKYCAKSTLNELGTHEIQIGSGPESTRKCFGDSGGPTYMEVMTKEGLQTRVIGITSHAYDEAVCMKGGLDTRVDAWLSWIDAKMREGCQTGARSWCEFEGIIPPQFFQQPKVPSNQISGIAQRLIAFIIAWLR